MSLFDLFRRRPPSAAAARDRLQVLLAHERASIGNNDLIATLKDEILAVIAKHVKVDRDAVTIKIERGDQVSMLEIDVEVPAAIGAAKAA